MGPLGIKPPRLRVALIAVLSALALTAVAAPGAAQAKDNLSLSCIPATVDLGKRSNCLVTVSSTGGPAPTGQVGFGITGFTGFLDLGPETCFLKPVSANASFCSLPIVGYVPGEENLFAHFPIGGEENAAADSTEITVREGSFRVVCSPPLIVQGEQAVCEAFVPATPGAPPPTGAVKFGSIGFFSALWPGEVDSECDLEPIDEGSRCRVTHTPVLAGEYGVLAEYQGDENYPSGAASGMVLAAEDHRTTVETSCDHTKPVFATLVKCTTTVTNDSPTGGPPPGEVGFDTVSEENKGVFFGPPCVLEPIGASGKQSACSSIYRSHTLGPQTVEGMYLSDEDDHYEGGRGFFDLDVQTGRATSTVLVCGAPQVGTAVPCTATVTDPGPNPVQPKGTVAFSRFGTGFSTFSPTTCQLTPGPSPATSSCQTTYKKINAGSETLVADYQGDPTTHRPSQGKADK